jgi:hypothetical protein
MGNLASVTPNDLRHPADNDKRSLVGLRDFARLARVLRRNKRGWLAFRQQMVIMGSSGYARDGAIGY